MAPKKFVVKIAVAYANCEATRLSKRDNTKHHNGKENRKLLFAQLSLIVVDGSTIA